MFSLQFVFWELISLVGALQCKNDEEIVAVIAHELGHWKLNHTMYSFIAVQVSQLIPEAHAFSLIHISSLLLFYNLFEGRGEGSRRDQLAKKVNEVAAVLKLKTSHSNQFFFFSIALPLINYVFCFFPRLSIYLLHPFLCDLLCVGTQILGVSLFYIFDFCRRRLYQKVKNKRDAFMEENNAKL